MEQNQEAMKEDFECELSKLIFECYHNHFIEEGNTTETLNSELHISPDVFGINVIIDYNEFENKLLDYIKNHDDKMILIKILISIIAISNSVIDWDILSKETLGKLIFSIDKKN